MIEDPFKQEEIPNQPDKNEDEDMPPQAHVEMDTEKEDRRKMAVEALEARKERLLFNYEATALVIAELSQVVQNNPDVSKKELLDVYANFAVEYELDHTFSPYFEKAITEYVRKHSIVKKYTEKYSNPSVLYEVVFGQKPRGTVQTIVGAMSIYFKCSNPDDYAYAYHHWSYADDKNPITKKHYKEAHLSDGVSIQRIKDKSDLHGVITVENTYNKKQNKDKEYKVSSDRTRVHEDMHVFNKLFVPKEDEILNRIVSKLSRADNIKVALDAHVRLKRRSLGIDTNARDEVLAFYKDGRSVANIYEILTTHSLYDYKNKPFYKHKIETIPDFLRNKSIFKFRPELTDEMIRQTIDRVFGEEYKRDILSWTQSIEKLESIGIQRDEIIRLLYQESAQKWPHLARRFVGRTNNHNL